MTLDVPQKEAAYIRHRGPSFRAELNSLFIAFVTTEMKREGYEWSAPEGASNGKAVFDAIRACPVDVEGACLSGLDLFNALRASAPILDDEEMHIFDRVKDYGRKVELA